MFRPGIFTPYRPAMFLTELRENPTRFRPDCTVDNLAVAPVTDFSTERPGLVNLLELNRLMAS